MTLSITILCHCAECCYAECRILFIAMLNVIMQDVIMLSVIMLSVVAPQFHILYLVLLEKHLGQS